MGVMVVFLAEISFACSEVGRLSEMKLNSNLLILSRSFFSLALVRGLGWETEKVPPGCLRWWGGQPQPSEWGWECLVILKWNLSEEDLLHCLLCPYRDLPYFLDCPRGPTS